MSALSKKEKQQAYSLWIVQNLENLDRTMIQFKNSLANNDFEVAVCESRRMTALLENILRTQEQIRSL